MRYGRSQQGGLYYARQRRKANALLQSLTPWSEGLNVTAGQYVSAENGTSAWIANDSGTTGSTPITGYGVQSDGAVEWTRVDTQSLLQFLYTGAPTP